MNVDVLCSTCCRAAEAQRTQANVKLIDFVVLKKTNDQQAGIDYVSLNSQSTCAASLFNCNSILTLARSRLYHFI